MTLIEFHSNLKALTLVVKYIFRIHLKVQNSDYIFQQGGVGINSI